MTGILALCQNPMYQRLIKPFLFLFKPERAHHLALKLFKLSLNVPVLGYFLSSSFSSKQKSDIELAGLQFPNRVGLAAGFDKDGRYMNLMSRMGFGFLEIGTVTPLPQDGNPKPRLFRLPKDEALINRMGFNNDGVDAMVARLKERRPTNVILGANIGKNKVTPNAEATRDYEICFEKLFDWVDYFVVNVSSPNTPGLRELQEKGPLLEILNALQRINRSKEALKPLFLKIAPDLTEGQLKDIADIVVEADITGIVATNTTISRKDLLTDVSEIEAIGAGGLSGKPVMDLSTTIIAHLRKLLGPNKIIIGVGGIRDAKTARDKINAGADLVQIYSGMIYEGPWIVKRIAESL